MHILICVLAVSSCIYKGLGNLEQLNLQSNRLTQLNTYTFVGLRQMQYLNLDSNCVSSVDVGAFQNLPNLGHVILSNNPLTGFFRLNFFGSRLQYIDASHVGLERIPQSLTHYVRDLKLSRNNITRITLGDLDSYPHLNLLVLDGNAIKDVDDDALGRQEYLARLWLKGNRLTRVPMNLPRTLVALYIDENLITELPANSFLGLSKLKQLFLQRNQIRNISVSALSDLTNLKTLDLQANLIQLLPNYVFSNLSDLQTLDISHNLLQLLQPQCFQGLDALETLQMSRIANKVVFEEYVFDPLKMLIKLEMYDSSELVADIIRSPRTLHGLRNVKELNIMHNKLTHLRSDFPSFFPKLEVLKVGGNTFHCGPEVRWFSEWVKTSSIQFYSSYSIRCASPVTLQFKPVMLLKEEDFVEITTQHAPMPQARHNCMGCRERYARIQRSSSISYRHQHEEVNILTVSDDFRSRRLQPLRHFPSARFPSRSLSFKECAISVGAFAAGFPQGTQRRVHAALYVYAFG
ncbi:hypothetical protein MTO96_029446 [Rhipicephalus appendiculatus]